MKTSPTQWKRSARLDAPGEGAARRTLPSVASCRHPAIGAKRLRASRSPAPSTLHVEPSRAERGRG